MQRIAGLTGIAHATDISWSGAAGTPLPFTTGSNWVGGATGSGDNAFINNGGVATRGKRHPIHQ